MRTQTDSLLIILNNKAGTIMNTAYALDNRYDVARRGSARFDAIEWEELPSLSGLLSQRIAAAGTRHLAANSEPSPFDSTTRFPVWTETMPSALDPLEPSGPFREAISGLSTREVHEPDVFRHFFGPASHT